MTDNVGRCARCGAENAPKISGWVGFSADLKARVLSEVCAACWEAWKATQLMALNEYRLNLGREDHRAILEDLGAEFLGLKSPETNADNDELSLNHLQQQWKPVDEDG
ncbi:MAG: Fe(2+)-trafficking protein [Myxococcales bacterium]|nr:Fe(2+)-trafficking protein [Myxococcales bacterium]